VNMSKSGAQEVFKSCRDQNIRLASRTPAPERPCRAVRSEVRGLSDWRL
jgi:hypothetical protein